VNPFEEKIKNSFPELVSLKSADQKIYLVGGFVRDFLLNANNRDVDVVCDHDSVALAKKWAEKTHGAFFVMDEERKTCRVIVPQENGKLVFDFALFRGNCIEEDLTLRDFTVNAIAVDLEEPGKLIDPCAGQNDLLQHVLRACSEKSILDDPIRILRAARYSATYSLNIAPETELQITQQVHLLELVSGERKRDELFKILGLSQPTVALTLLEKWHVFEALHIHPVAQTSLHLVEIVNQMIVESFSTILKQVEQYALGDLQENIQKYLTQLAERNTTDRTAQQLLLVACLLWDQEITKTEQYLRELLLSRDELERLRKSLFKQDSLLSIDLSSPENQKRAIYLYFKEMGLSGLDLAVIHLGETLLAAGEKDQLQVAIRLFQTLFYYWFECPEIVRPVPWLSGNELMLNFDLTPGPYIGGLLELMKEEQAAGNIKSKEDAFRWSEEQVMSYRNRKRWAD
jgi:tRNA nucleotidyltransferase/poly(A) polymerase